MKTYTKTIEAPRLVIEYDKDAERPREDTNLGYFITVENKYHSPDRDDQLVSIIRETGEEAVNVEEHMLAIGKRIKERGEKAIYIVPVYRYEHGNVIYRRGTAHGFDYSNCGFYIVTDRTRDNYAQFGTAIKDLKKFEKIIDAELETYTKWVNGEIYAFTLYDEEGVEEDYGCGFYSLDDIRDYLPAEWAEERLEDYIQH